MGTWSGAIFGNDLACDVRDAFESELSKGLNATAATRTVIKQFSDDLSDDPDRWIVWIALAAVQQKHGKPTSIVRKNALNGIAWAEDPEAGSSVWPFSSSTMNRLRKALGGTLAKKKSTPKRKAPLPSPGDVVAITLRNKRKVVVVILGVRESRGPEWIRVLWLRGLAVSRANAKSIGAALRKWKPYRKDWGRGIKYLGRIFGGYDVQWPLPAQSTELLVAGVSIPSRLMVMLSRPRCNVELVERPSDLRYHIQNDLWEWTTWPTDWIVDPAWNQDQEDSR
jgi:hypothetical protein